MGDLDRLFYWRGVAASYLNYRGEHVDVPESSRINLLKAMGVDVSSAEAIEAEAYRLDVEPWNHWFQKLSVIRAGVDSSVEINFHPGDVSGEVVWELANADGEIFRTSTIHYDELEEVGEYQFDQLRYSRRKILLGELEPNYYRLQISSDRKTESTVLAACPREVFRPSWFDKDERIWGVLIQLYTLKSNRNWGIGDFTDLRELIEALAKKGADTIGLNPLHALSPSLDEYFSPYSPSDRRFINPLYIDPYWLTDYTEQVKQSLDRTLLAALRAASKVDYQKVRELKFPVFEGMFKVFLEQEVALNGDRFIAFKRYVEDNGVSLIGFAYYEASHQIWTGAYYILPGGVDEQRNIEALFSSDDHHSRAVLFYCYLQWLAQEQLESCQRAALQQGMKIGLIRDLAVGSDATGAEISSHSELFCRNAAIGAPPDPMAQKGQNWGLPPAIPAELRKSGYKHFIELLQANMKNCGALRIDHAMSLLRLWWCPPGDTADNGAYVYYPFRELLGLLTLESHLNKCVIIAEDLGVVPDDFRQGLAEARALSNKVFYFEKEHEDQFRLPQNYDTNALAMVNNHDVPTLVSWWNGTDLLLRRELDLFEEGVSYEDSCEARLKDKELLMSTLYQTGLYPENWHGRSIDEPADEPLVESILLHVSRAASKFFVFQLEDLLMMDDPVNVPGTFKEHANWQRKLTSTLEDIFADSRIDAVLDKINKQRKL